MVEEKLEEEDYGKCETCLDFIVCYAYDTLGRENCPDYRPDFMSYQDFFEKKENNI